MQEFFFSFLYEIWWLKFSGSRALIFVAHAEKQAILIDGLKFSGSHGWLFPYARIKLLLQKCLYYYNE